MKRLRVWRLNRSYRRIARLELKLTLNHPAVQQGRLTFATETMNMLDRGLVARAVPRQARRKMQRALVGGKAA